MNSIFNFLCILSVPTLVFGADATDAGTPSQTLAKYYQSQHEQDSPARSAKRPSAVAVVSKKVASANDDSALSISRFSGHFQRQMQQNSQAEKQPETRSSYLNENALSVTNPAGFVRMTPVSHSRKAGSNVQRVQYSDEAVEEAGYLQAPQKLTQATSVNDGSLQVIGFDQMFTGGQIQLSNVPTPDSGKSDVPENRAKAMMSANGSRFANSGQGYTLPRPSRNSIPLCHNPLYFEDPNLERCGRGNGCLTDAASAIHLFGRMPMISYMMTVRPPSSLVRAKPDCPTGHQFGLDAYVPNPTELDLAGLSVQSAAAVGLIFLIP